jgi:D-arabinose 1-dehydrogenase-like Zn-dependent alcohol dehydrogenase
MDFLMQAVLKNIEVKGSTMGSRAEFRDMVDFVKRTKAVPAVSRVVKGMNLEGEDGGIEALFQDMMKASQFGKLVVEVDGGSGGGQSRL